MEVPPPPPQPSPTTTAATENDDNDIDIEWRDWTLFDCFGHIGTRLRGAAIVENNGVEAGGGGGVAGFMHAGDCNGKGGGMGSFFVL